MLQVDMFSNYGYWLNVKMTENMWMGFIHILISISCCSVFVELQKFFIHVRELYQSKKITNEISAYVIYKYFCRVSFMNI